MPSAPCRLRFSRTLDAYALLSATCRGLPALQNWIDNNDPPQQARLDHLAMRRTLHPGCGCAP